MRTLYRYTVVGTDGIDGETEYETLTEAKHAACLFGEPKAVRSHRYARTDSYLAWTPTASWPPLDRADQLADREMVQAQTPVVNVQEEAPDG